MSKADTRLHAKYGVYTHQSEAAYTAIRSAILSGRCARGTKLNERFLTRDFGFNRTPVRHALAKLTAEGLAEHVPYVGTFVRKLDIAETLELIHFRRGMESACAATAAVRITPNEARDLLQLAAEVTQSEDILAAAHDPQAREAANVRARERERLFHQRITELADNNEMLTAVNRACTIHFALCPGSTDMGPTRLRSGSMGPDHNQVALAIADRHPQKAFGAMWDHFNALLHAVNTMAQTAEADSTGVHRR